MAMKPSTSPRENARRRQLTSNASAPPSLPAEAWPAQPTLLAAAIEDPSQVSGVCVNTPTSNSAEAPDPDTGQRVEPEVNEPGEPQFDRPAATLIERADVVTTLLTIIIAVNLIHVGFVLSSPDRSPQRQRVGAVRFITNVNTAPASEISLLPGIGPALAQRIVLDRETNGPFGSLDDLGRVRGIGPKTIIQITPLVVLSFETTVGSDDPQ